MRRDTPDSIHRDLAARAAAAGDPRLVITFPVEVPKNFDDVEVLKLLEAQGYTRVHARTKTTLEVVQDRFRMSSAERTRVIEALEAALRVGQGRANVSILTEDGSGEAAPTSDASFVTRDRPWKYSTDFHCAGCDIHYSEPTPSFFSFNSPLGACETCRGFGRVIGIDFGLVIPDESKTLAAVRSSPGNRPASASPRTISKSMRRSAASRSTCRGANSPMLSAVGCSRGRTAG